MSNLHPTHYVKSVADLNPNYSNFLMNSPRKFQAVTWDLDKTLTGQDEESLPQEHIDALMAINGIVLCQGIISNASGEVRTQRVKDIAAVLSELIGAEMFVITSRMVGGKKKPLRPPFDAMAEKIQIENRRICHIGDQLLKDVWGANRAGYGGSVLVAPYGEGDDPLVKYLQRPLEAIARPALGLPFRTKDF